MVVAVATMLLSLAGVVLLSPAGDILAQGDGGSLPARPTGLSIETATHDTVTFAWENPGDASITGYRILRRDTSRQGEGQFDTVVENTGSAATSHTDRDLAPETRYVYRVRAHNAAGVSPRSKFANGVTLPEPSDEPDPDDKPGTALTWGTSWTWPSRRSSGPPWTARGT